MGESGDQPNSNSDQVVEREGTYDHELYGEVEVTGIWKGVEEVDTTRNSNEKDVYIVRYSADEDGEQVDELTDTLDEFIESIE
ncbi:hypothetical protein [Natrarchaeobius chitinivorans]|uniref:Uncharacterized protein n=1 Tax=Natrarchaeobius chitinivorans TaxID=1679083 RepID=A0A3N6M1J5_NATCH|nr:hypothetical protein [Natrarchaeobius chitinivorans]RQG89630.1 hypothetical protein EA473_21715 [Natrarchaeobius chitinivorans]